MKRNCDAPFKTSKIHTISVAAIAGLLALSPTLSNAHSSKPHPFKSVSISHEAVGDAPSVRVIHNSAKYTGLEGNVSAVFRLKAKVKLRHRIYAWVVTTGDPANEDLLSPDLMGAAGGSHTRKLDVIANFSMDAVQAVSTGSWGTDPVSIQEIVDRCNAAFSQLPANDKAIGEFELTIHAGFAAGKKSRLAQATEEDTDWLANSEGRPGIAHTTLPVSIICAGHQENRSADVTPPRAGNELYSINFKVEQHGERCPKDVTVTAYADYRWPATAQMHMHVTGGMPKTRFAKSRKVTFAGKTFHRAERQFKYKLDPGQKTFTLTVDGKKKKKTKTIEIKCPPFKVLSAWLDYDVEDSPDCPKKVLEEAIFKTARPGWVDYEIRMKGGLVVSSGRLTSKRKGNEYVAVATRELTMKAVDTEFMADAVDYPANSGWVPLQLECLDLTGEITVADSANTPKNECPRQGQAVFKINSNLDSAIDYKVECSGGRSWQGTMSMTPKGAGKFQGVGAKIFDVSKTEFVSCALKRVKGNKHYVLSFAGHQFSCANRAVDTAADDLAPEPKQPDDPVPPQPTRNINGDFTYLDNAGDKCPRKGKALISLWSNLPGLIEYKFTCSGEIPTFGAVKPGAKPGGGWVVPALVTFEVTKTTTRRCWLDAKINEGGPYRRLALKHKKYLCKGRATDTAADDIVTESSTSSTDNRAENYTSSQDCKTHWKTTCKREPKEVCRKVYNTVCKMVPKRACRTVATRSCKNVKKTHCTLKPTRTCKRVPTTTCKMVRGNKVCRRTFKTQCTTVRKRVCKTKTVRQCSPTTKRVCERKMVEQCKRVAKSKCETKWTKSCKRKKTRVCK